MVLSEVRIERHFAQTVAGEEGFKPWQAPEVRPGKEPGARKCPAGDSSQFGGPFLGGERLRGLVSGGVLDPQPRVRGQVTDRAAAFGAAANLGHLGSVAAEYHGFIAFLDGFDEFRQAGPKTAPKRGVARNPRSYAPRERPPWKSTSKFLA